jgi:prefoldin beta subunit
MTKAEVEEKIQQLQIFEQSLQNLLAQKQALQLQIMETESALNELKKVKSAYKIIGNIMVASDKPDLEKDLTNRKETTEIRLKAIEKQERAAREKASKVQEEVLSELKKEK